MLCFPDHIENIPGKCFVVVVVVIVVAAAVVVVAAAAVVVCEEIRLSVEFVTVGFLRICRHSCVTDSRGYGDGVLAC